MVRPSVVIFILELSNALINKSRSVVYGLFANTQDWFLHRQRHAIEFPSYFLQNMRFQIWNLGEVPP